MRIDKSPLTKFSKIKIVLQHLTTGSFNKSKFFVYIHQLQRKTLEIIFGGIFKMFFIRLNIKFCTIFILLSIILRFDKK